MAYHGDPRWTFGTAQVLPNQMTITTTTTKVPPLVYPWDYIQSIWERPVPDVWTPPVKPNAADTFRSEYKPLSKHQSESILAIKAKAKEMESLLSFAPGSWHTTEHYQQMDQAKLRLQEVVMWATKAIT